MKILTLCIFTSRLNLDSTYIGTYIKIGYSKYFNTIEFKNFKISKFEKL